MEDYIANEETFQKGSELLSTAFHLKDHHETGAAFRNWRDMIPVESTARDIVSLFRLNVTNIIAHLYTTN